MRGLYTAAVLNTLADRYKSDSGSVADIGKGFNLIVGTSTGGILASGLAAGVPLEKIISLYCDNGQKIFKSPMPRHGLFKLTWAIRNFLSPANSNEQLHGALHNVFKDETIGELFGRREIGLCITSVNVATHKARVFKTGHDPKRRADDERKIIDVCLASSAAPIIFPIAGIPDPQNKNGLSHFVDGGLWANNPILVALIESLAMAKPMQPIEILSIGTCPPPSGMALTTKEANRGVFGWNFGVKALELSMDAQASGNHSMASFLSEHFIKMGRQIDIIRLDQSAPSSDQAKYLGLDSANEKACSTLIQLGNADALDIYGKSLSINSQYKKLTGIFSSMPMLESTQGERI